MLKRFINFLISKILKLVHFSLSLVTGYKTDNIDILLLYTIMYITHFIPEYFKLFSIAIRLVTGYRPANITIMFGILFGIFISFLFVNSFVTLTTDYYGYNFLFYLILIFLTTNLFYLKFNFVIRIYNIIFTGIPFFIEYRNQFQGFYFIANTYLFFNIFLLFISIIWIIKLEVALNNYNTNIYEYIYI